VLHFGYVRKFFLRRRAKNTYRSKWLKIGPLKNELFFQSPIDLKLLAHPTESAAIALVRVPAGQMLVSMKL